MSTATKTRRKPAAEAPTFEWAQLIETALTMPGSVGNTYCRFYDYSFTNQCLLMMQGVLEPVATYNRWSDIGRQVKKSEKAKWILRPIMGRKQDKTTGEEVRQLIGFKGVRCLFTLSQTDGDPLPEVDPPGWDLGRCLGELDITKVDYASIDGNAQGWSVERTYAVNPVAVDPTHTTFHELGHIILGHTTRDALAEYATHRGLMEFQAEAVAYLVLNELGLATEDVATHARGYIQGWMRGSDPPEDRAIKAVFSAADKILKAGKEPR